MEYKVIITNNPSEAKNIITNTILLKQKSICVQIFFSFHVCTMKGFLETRCKTKTSAKEYMNVIKNV